MLVVRATVAAELGEEAEDEVEAEKEERTASQPMAWTRPKIMSRKVRTAIGEGICSGDWRAS